MMPSLLEQKAAEVVDNIRESKEDSVEGVVGDPMTILMVISIILACVQIWQRCEATPAVALERLQGSPSIPKWRLRRLIRSQSKQYPPAERPEFRIAMSEAIYKMGSNLTVEEMEQLFKEAEEKSKQA